MFDAKHTAFLFMDFQHDVCAPGGRMVSQDEAVLARFADARRAAARMLGGIRHAGAAVVHIHHGFEPGYPEHRGVRATVRMERYVQQQSAFVWGTPGAEPVPELAPVEGEAVFRKHTISPFASTALAVWLQRRNLHTLVLAGVVTHYVVLATGMEANDRGFRVIVAADACASAGAERHETALGILRPLCEISDVDAVLGVL